MRHHARLEREALEQRLAEAVDGHDRQAGGQVEHLARAACARAPARAAVAGAAEQIREIRRQLLPPGAVARRPSSCWTRATISAAAALVKVRQSSWRGSLPASSRRSTRSASTRVLPVPAEAVTQTEQVGSAARRWAAVGGSRRAASAPGSRRSIRRAAPDGRSRPARRRRAGAAPDRRSAAGRNARSAGTGPSRAWAASSAGSRAAALPLLAAGLVAPQLPEQQLGHGRAPDLLERARPRPSRPRAAAGARSPQTTSARSGSSPVL